MNRTTALALMILTPILTSGQDRTAANSSLEPASARQVFAVAQNLSAEDGGELWGVRLYGPMILADPATRQMIANEPDSAGVLQADQTVFVGILPKDQGIANTAVDWGGKRWTMLVWPLPDDEHDRRSIIAHELWHRIQNRLGLSMNSEPTTHLGSHDGRVWLQLEWRALAAALRASGSDQRGAGRDALAFRQYRRSLFEGAAEKERSLEMHEGLAEYTGSALSGRPPSENLEAAARHLKKAEEYPTFVRSFAYASGPAYGLLLDEADPGWRKKLSSDDDLGELLAQALDLKVPDSLSDFVKRALTKYDGKALLAREDELEKERQSRLAQYRRKFVTGPLLELKFYKMNVQFDPGKVDVLDDVGNVYPSLRLEDEWGILTATGGALITKNWSRVIVPAPKNPDGSTIAGEGYTLELNQGWSLVPSESRDGYRVKRDR